MQWTASNTAKAKYLGAVEIEGGGLFEILQDTDRLIFGGSCNCGFLESGFIRREDGESTDETLEEMVVDMETYYRDGPSYVSRIVCNERM